MRTRAVHACHVHHKRLYQFDFAVSNLRYDMKSIYVRPPTTRASTFHALKRKSIKPQRENCDFGLHYCLHREISKISVSGLGLFINVSISKLLIDRSINKQKTGGSYNLQIPVSDNELLFETVSELETDLHW